MLAFLMAIVMIVTFANFGTLSAFANDDESIENTEITLEDNTEGNSEEQQVEELVSEIPELVSEPSSPDDPIENENLGDISSGEVNSSQIVAPDSVGAATTTRINDYTITVTPTKVGPITIRAQIYVDGTTTTHTSYRCDFITVPDFYDNFAYIENQQTKQFVEIEDSSTNTGAIIQQGAFDGANNSRWTFELEWWGFFSIKSVHSNLYIGVDSSNTSLVKQYSNENDYTKWLFTETSNGSYTIQHKVISSQAIDDSYSDESFNDIKEENTTGVSDSGEVIVSAKNVSKLYSGMTIGDAVEILGFRGYEYGSSREINVRTWHLDDGSHLNLYYVIDYTKFGSSISFSEIDQYAICTSAYIIKENETTTLFGSD